MFKTKIIVLTKPLGERIPIIIDSKSGIPDPLTNQYLLNRRRGVVSFNTVKKEAITLVRFLNWVSENHKRGLSLEFLQNKDLSSLWDYLRESNSHELVSGPLHMYRWKVVERFLDFQYSKELLQLSHRDPNYKALVEKKKVLMKEFELLSYSVKKRRLKGLDEDAFTLLLSLSREGNYRNPFIERDKLRNELMIDLLGVLGMRSGEVLKLTTDQVFLGGSNPHIIVKKLFDDHMDSRRMEPRVKTYGRVINIDQAISRKLDMYFSQRRKVNGAKKHPYLFISHVSGEPISYRRLNDMLRKLENSHPKLEGLNLTPHSLRRTWNDLFREQAEEQGVSEELITQSQNYLQGRVLDSSEAYKYAAKSIENKARRCLLDFQKEILNRHLP